MNTFGNGISVQWKHRGEVNTYDYVFSKKRYIKLFSNLLHYQRFFYTKKYLYQSTLINYIWWQMRTYLRFSSIVHFLKFCRAQLHLSNDQQTNGWSLSLKSASVQYTKIFLYHACLEVLQSTTTSIEWLIN